MLNDDGKIFGEKLEGVEYIKRVGVYGITFNKEGKVAVIKTPKGYYLPGGGMENKETHDECIKREFIEETGYEIEVGKYINKFSLYHKTKDDAYLYLIGYFYIVSLKDKTNAITEQDHELVWVESTEAIKCLNAKHQKYAVSEALKNINKQ